MERKKRGGGYLEVRKKKHKKRIRAECKIAQRLFFQGHGTFQRQSHTKKLHFLPWGVDHLLVGDWLSVRAVLHPPQAPLYSSVSTAWFGHSSLRCSLQLLRKSGGEFREYYVTLHFFFIIKMKWKNISEDRIAYPKKGPLGSHTHLGSLVKFLFI